MSDTTIVELRHTSGKNPESRARHFHPGETIIPARLPMNKLFCLAEGVAEIKLTEEERKKHALLQFTGNDVEGERSWAILGSRPFFDKRLNPRPYIARTGCQVYIIDSRMFQMRSDDLISVNRRIRIAVGLVCNSDKTGALAPHVAKKMQIPVPERLTRRGIQQIIQTMLEPERTQALQRFALQELQKALDVRIERSCQPSLVGAPALAQASPSARSVPPPPPGARGRQEWESSRG